MHNINTALMAKELTENPERPTKEPANIKEYISALHPHRKCGRDWNGSLHIRVILRAAACRSGSKGHVREQLHRHGEAEQKKRTDLACLIVMKELITFQVCFWAK